MVDFWTDRFVSFIFRSILIFRWFRGTKFCARSWCSPRFCCIERWRWVRNGWKIFDRSKFDTLLRERVFATSNTIRLRNKWRIKLRNYCCCYYYYYTLYIVLTRNNDRGRTCIIFSPHLLQVVVALSNSLINSSLARACFLARIPRSLGQNRPTRLKISASSIAQYARIRCSLGTARVQFRNYETFELVLSPVTVHDILFIYFSFFPLELFHRWTIVHAFIFTGNDGRGRRGGDPNFQCRRGSGQKTENH